MKKVFAILLIAALMFSLTGCFGSSKSSNETPELHPQKLSYYTAQGFYGLQLYMVDYELVPYVDLAKYAPATVDEKGATKDEPAADETSGTRTAVYYDLLGADYGIRFMLSSSAFVEFYDFGNADSDLAKKTLADIKDDGKISIEGSPDELTGVISKSGKYVALYNEKKSFDYSKIKEALEKNW